MKYTHRDSGTKLRDLVDQRFANAEMFHAATLETELFPIDLGELRQSSPQNPRLSGAFGENCILWATATVRDRFLAGKGRLTIKSVSTGQPRNAAFIVMSEDLELRIMFRQHQATFIVGTGAVGKLDARLNDQKPLAVIGDDLVSRGLRLAVHGREICIGIDCLIGEGSVIQGHDAHGIVDLRSDRILNSDDRRTVLEAHVWLAQRVLVMPGVTIGKGSIVGATGVVTHDVPPCSLALGVPARVAKSDVTWSRSRKTIDGKARSFIEGL